MIWADRVAIVVALLLSPVMLFGIDGLSGIAVDLALVVWFVLRAADFIGTGGVRRRRSFR